MRGLSCLLTLGLVCGAASGPLSAHEPDGRLAFRYEWTTPPTPGAPATLRLTLTVEAPLEAALLQVSIPDRTGLTLRSGRRLEGALLPITEDEPWPTGGLAVGDLKRGETIVLEMAVVSPEAGGGIMTIGVDAEIGEAHVHEGVGIPVGRPGTAPVLRNGAAEFPAGRGEPGP